MIGHVFTLVIYQPFFNLLVLIYQFLERITAKADMGWAVIIFTIAFRIIILPLSLHSGRSEKEKYEISEKFKEIQEKYAHDPIKAKQLRRKLVRTNPITIASEFFDVFIQVLIALMLYRMFTTGLEGADLHLLYRFAPKITLPFNLTFMGKYDLTHPNTFINLVNTIVIFLAEYISLRLSPFPMGKNEKAALIVLPIGAYLFFSQMPAGKKLFVITTLVFSIFLMLIKRISFSFTKGSPAFKAWVETFHSQITSKSSS